MEGASSALTAEEARLPWLRNLITPCSSTADLFGNLKGEGESMAAAWASRSGLPSFMVAGESTSGRSSPFVASFPFLNRGASWCIERNP